MPIDLNKYRPYVDDFDLTEEEKLELMHTVWSMMESFVDQAFGLHPVQQCNGQDKEKDCQVPMRVLESDGTPSTPILAEPQSPTLETRQIHKSEP